MRCLDGESVAVVSPQSHRSIADSLFHPVPQSSQMYVSLSSVICWLRLAVVSVAASAGGGAVPVDGDVVVAACTVDGYEVCF